MHDGSNRKLNIFNDDKTILFNSDHILLHEKGNICLRNFLFDGKKRNTTICKMLNVLCTFAERVFMKPNKGGDYSLYDTTSPIHPFDFANANDSTMKGFIKEPTQNKSRVAYIKVLPHMRVETHPDKTIEKETIEYDFLDKVKMEPVIYNHFLYIYNYVMETLELTVKPLTMAIIHTPTTCDHQQAWHLDSYEPNNAIIIPLNSGHMHTEFLNYDYVRYTDEINNGYDSLLNINWDEHTKKHGYISHGELDVGDVLFFNTNNVHRGPKHYNKTESRYVIFMTWPVCQKSYQNMVIDDEPFTVIFEPIFKDSIKSK